MRTRFALALAVASAPAATARADTTADPIPTEAARSRWAIAMVGGIASPLGALADDHQAAMLLVGARGSWSRSVDWTLAPIELGLEAGLDYSPLLRRPTDDGSRLDIFHGVPSLGARAAYAGGSLRVALVAAAAFAIDHTATLTAPLERPLTAGGGLIVTGGWTHPFGALDYQYWWVMAGLVESL